MQQRPIALPELKRSVSPGPSSGYNYYDRYVPSRSPPVYRDGYTNNFGADLWRPERAYYGRSPSPERYRDTPTENWDGPLAWKDVDQSGWSDRREPRIDSYGQLVDRNQRDTMATRMFEPSDTWKQSHTEPNPFDDGPSRERANDRFPEPLIRDFRDRSVDRPRVRDHYSPPHFSGDRYRPYSPGPNVAQPGDPLGPLRSPSYHPPSPEREPAVRACSVSISDRHASVSTTQSRYPSSVPSRFPLPKKPEPWSPSCSSVASYVLPHVQADQSRSPVRSDYPDRDSLASTPHEMNDYVAHSRVASVTGKFVHPPPSVGNDGKLKLEEVSTHRVQEPPRSGRLSSDLPAEGWTRDDIRVEEGSDMDMSLPPSPVVKSPVMKLATPAPEVYPQVESQVCLSPTTSGRQSLGETSERVFKKEDEIAMIHAGAHSVVDDSDMEMSPPLSPILFIPVVLAIDNIFTSSQPTAIPGLLHVEQLVSEHGGSSDDDSDMEMSSPSSVVSHSHTLGSPRTVIQESVPPEGKADVFISDMDEHLYTEDVGHVDERMEYEPSKLLASSPAPVVIEPLAPLDGTAFIKGLHTVPLSCSPIATRPSPASADTTVISDSIASGFDASPDLVHSKNKEFSDKTPSPVDVANNAATLDAVAVDHLPDITPETGTDTTHEPAPQDDVGRELPIAQENTHDKPRETEIVIERGNQPCSGQNIFIADDEKPLSEALRMVVTMRLRCDRQTQEERVNPVLLANVTVAEQTRSQPTPPPNAVVQEVMESERRRSMEDAFDGTKYSLRLRFAQHQAALAEKVKRLRKEYLTLHEKWLTHCAKLDEAARTTALEEAAATAGRTTRRTAAMGDAVRSDLEMEQILASLGNEELTDANHLSARNAATIPDMVAVTTGRVDYVYDDTNNLVDDPHEFYKPDTGMDDWTEEEKIFLLEKYAIYPKQFGIIADYLPNKTASQCVTYYYLHKHTTTDFRKVVSRYVSGKRKRNGRAGKQKSNALLTDIRQHDDEVSRASNAGGSTSRRKRGAPTQASELRRTASRKSTTQSTPTPTPTPDPEPARRTRRRANPSARAAAAMEQDGFEDPTETDAKPAKRGRKSRKVVKSAETVSSPAPDEISVVVNETKFIDQTEFTTRRKPTPGSVNWSDDDKGTYSVLPTPGPSFDPKIHLTALFFKLLAQHGDDFKRIAASMPNKTTIQVSTFYKANQAELELDKVAASAPKRSPTPETGTDMWKETSFLGSETITPTTTKSSTPAEGMSAPVLDVDLRFRTSRHVSPSRRSKLQEGLTQLERELRPVVTSADSSGPYQFRQTSMEAMRAQYNPPLTRDSLRSGPFATASPSEPDLNGSATGDSSFINHNSLSSYPSVPATLTTTFPSTFAYSNLSPSHFAGDQRPTQRTTVVRDIAPPGRAH
ncbi:hypothetical protein A0H81_12347 [Grifola frondosa]|uniref:SANT domain-containing protein n=1 Tax=Grifola frondosa TaxID=5627 RepID=A0A1C7LUI4_GRIFR|nr:hypothetical protein A0H81_12347 [Grifola frondosa]